MVARALVLLVASTVLAGAAAGSSDNAPTSLTITYWADEQASRSPSARWALQCGPTRGTLPTRQVACRRLAGTKASSFAAVPRTAICTQIYGGPQKAVVKGRLRGRPVWASFRRRNGCEIDRWQRFSPWLIPRGGVSG